MHPSGSFPTPVCAVGLLRPLASQVCRLWGCVCPAPPGGRISDLAGEPLPPPEECGGHPLPTWVPFSPGGPSLPGWPCRQGKQEKPVNWAACPSRVQPLGPASLPPPALCVPCVSLPAGAGRALWAGSFSRRVQGPQLSYSEAS